MPVNTLRRQIASPISPDDWRRPAYGLLVKLGAIHERLNMMGGHRWWARRP